MSKIITGDSVRPAQTMVLQEFNAQKEEVPEQDEDEQEEVHEITAEEIEAIKQQAYEEGFQRGVSDGLAEAAKQADQFRLEVEQVISLFTKPLEQFDDELESELVKLSVSVAKQIVRRELKMDPNQVMAVIREAIAALPIASQNVKFYIHPEDAAIVRSVLPPPSEGEVSWAIVEDPLLQRGGCRVETLTSEIDATIENRVAAIAAAILGGERQGDS